MPMIVAVAHTRSEQAVDLESGKRHHKTTTVGRPVEGQEDHHQSH